MFKILNTLGKTLIQLLEICLIELDKVQTHLLEIHSNCNAFLRILTSIIRFASLFYYKKDFFLSKETLGLSDLICKIVKNLAAHKPVVSCVWQWVFKGNLLNNLLLSEYVYDDSVEFKCVKLLLECGLDPDASSSKESRTCLNTFVFNRDVKTKKECDQLILLLLRNGAHLDAAAANNLTAADKYRIKYSCNLFSLIKQPLRHISLQCMASKAIRRHSIVYKNILSAKLCNFVDMH